MKNNNDLSPLHKIVVGAQFLFVAFGATVLVPLLVGVCGFVVDGRPPVTTYSEVTGAIS